MSLGVNVSLLAACLCSQMALEQSGHKQIDVSSFITESLYETYIKISFCVHF